MTTPPNPAFLDSLQGWRDVEAIATRPGHPVVAHLGIEGGSGPLLRVDIDATAGLPGFKDARIAHGMAYIGYGQHVFVVDLALRELTGYALDGYFCRLSALDEGCASAPLAMLATSASEVLAFSRSGALAWRQTGLGADGVLIVDAANGVLRGAGEWDPPGGWRDFTLALATGDILSGA